MMIRPLRVIWIDQRKQVKFSHRWCGIVWISPEVLAECYSFVSLAHTTVIINQRIYRCFMCFFAVEGIYLWRVLQNEPGKMTMLCPPKQTFSSRRFEGSNSSATAQYLQPLGIRTSLVVASWREAINRTVIRKNLCCFTQLYPIMFIELTEIKLQSTLVWHYVTQLGASAVARRDCRMFRVST